MILSSLVHRLGPARVASGRRWIWISALVGGLCAGTLSSGVGAADASGKFAVKGVARTPCKTYVTAWDQRREKLQAFALYAGWIDGYLSALNERNEGTYDLTSFEGTQLLANYVYANCKRVPEQPFFNVMRSLVKALTQNRLVAQSPLVMVEGNVTAPNGTSHDVRIHLYEETVRRMQQSLTAVGDYAGEVDGTYSEVTRKAVADFQTRSGLPASGLPDQVTMTRLFRPATVAAPPAKKE